jgi:hypothetical protein
VLWALEEMRLPFELAGMDDPAHDLGTEAYRRLSVLSAGIKDEALIAPYPGIASYRDRCLARPAWKRALEAYCARVEAG